MIRAVAAIAASVALLTAASPAAVGADVPEPDPTTPSPTADAVAPEEAGDTADVAARLIGLTPAALDPSSRLNASVMATNSGEVAADDVVLELALTERPLADREALDAFLDDPESFPSRVAAQQPEPVEATAAETALELAEGDDPEPAPAGPSIAPGTSRTLSIGATPAELELPSGRWGVYGAVLRMRTSQGTFTVEALPLTWAGASIPQLQLSVLARASGSENRVNNVLGASDLPGVTSAVDPTHVTNAVAFETGLVERETWRLANGSPDLTSLAHADETTLMDFALSLPAATNLASIDSAPWLAEPAALDEQSLAAASAHGAEAVLALPQATGYDELADAAGTAAVARAGDTRVLIPDAGLSETLAQHRRGTEATRAQVIAESALVAEEADGQPVLVVLDDDWQPASPEPSAALESLMAAPWVNPLPLSELLDGDAVSVDVPATLGVGADLPVTDVAALAQALDQLTTLAAATTSPETALADWGTELLRSTAVTLRPDPGVRDAAVASALAEVADTRAALRIAESSDLNLLAETGEIPITVVNSLDYDVTVRVDLTSFSPNLQVLASPTVTVPAGQEHAALVPVEAVSSANVRVAVVLRSDEGAGVSESQTFAVRVRADWGNAATAVFSVLLVLLLAAGLIRTARRGRKDTRAEPAPAPTSAPDSDSENVDLDDDPAEVEEPDRPKGTARD